ncbi:MAG: inverse autotransporter beta domain-containing protein [Candidatus Rhabdochlamydia sp.]
MKLLYIMTPLFLCASLYPTVSSNLSLRHRESEGIGYDTGYSTLDYLFSYQQGQTSSLCNLRAHLFNNGHTAGNLGLGMRHFLTEGTSEIGMNFFYDFRNYSIFFAQQISAGLEWMGSSFDLRCNGYLPFGRNKKFQERVFEAFDGYQAIIEQRLSTSLPSLDGEIGTMLFQNLYLAAGSYYLFQEESHAIYSGYGIGAKARVDLSLNPYIKIGSTITYDPIFHTRFQGYLSLSIPLGPKSSPPSRSHPISIERQEIIPIYTQRKTKISLSSLNDAPFNFFFVNNQATLLGKGTFEAPFSSLKEAEEQSQRGDIIYVYPGDGTARGMDEGIVLKEHQILASAGASLHLESLSIPAQIPGQKPLLTNIHPDEPVVLNPGLSDLSDFSFIDSMTYLMDDYLLLEEKKEDSMPSESVWDDPEIQEWIDLSNIKER